MKPIPYVRRVSQQILSQLEASRTRDKQDRKDSLKDASECARRIVRGIFCAK